MLGRGSPRWSLPVATPPLLRTGELGARAIVWVGPPLSARGPSWGSSPNRSDPGTDSASFEPDGSPTRLKATFGAPAKLSMSGAAPGLVVLPETIESIRVRPPAGPP